jgi:type I restriction enzyme, S subunit
MKMNVPSLRFRGFTDDWKHYDLNLLVNKFDNLRVPVSEKNRVPGLTPYYGANGIQSYVEGYTHKGEFVLLAEDGANDLKNYPVHYVNGEVWVNNHAHVLQGKPGFADTRYLGYAISQTNIESFLVGGGRAKLNASTLMKIMISVSSSTKEQIRIAVFLKNIDNLITLHQQKHEKLINVKKSLLDKMFPKNGEVIPSLRFKGFTDLWEQRDLLEVAKYRNGKAHENEIDEKGNFIVVNSKFVSTNGEIKKYTNTLIEKLYKDEIAFVLSDVPNGKAIARTFLVNDNDRYSLNQRIAGITPLESITPYFLSILMNRNKYFLSFDDGAKQTNLTKNDVEKFSSPYPNYLEQSKIGNLFSDVDNLITLYQQKHEKLINVKKALLQKMFV